MQKKVYPQSFKDEVVKLYSTNHTIAETTRKIRNCGKHLVRMAQALR